MDRASIVIYQETRYHQWDGHISVNYGLINILESRESIETVLDYIRTHITSGQELELVNLAGSIIIVHQGEGLEVSVKEGIGMRNEELHNLALKLTQ